jgi:hypothetical protein
VCRRKQRFRATQFIWVSCRKSSEISRKTPVSSYAPGVCYDRAMRRASAISLLGVFGLLLAIPSLPRDSEAQLPPCCRGNGKHHCAASRLASGLDVLTTPAFSASAERCPFYPTAGCVPLHPQAWLPATLPMLAGLFAARPAQEPRSEAFRPASSARTSQTRGPPCILA